MKTRTWGWLLCATALFGCGGDEADQCMPAEGPCEAYLLNAPVDLQRDSLGVVHIRGQSDNDVAYAQGYAMARERLFQMDLLRRQALGRRAEVLGADLVDDDIFMRGFNFGQLGRDNATTLHAEQPADFRLLEAWVSGANAYIDEVREGSQPLPYGFGTGELDYLPERWSNADPMAIGKLFLFSNANEIEFEILVTVLRQYFPDQYEELPIFAPLFDNYIVPEDERPKAGMQPLAGSLPPGHSQPNKKPATNRARPQLPADAAARFAAFAKKMAPIRPRASNNWALAGEHTENGRPLIAGDPHQPLRSPSLMWANHLDSTAGGGTLDAVGFSFVGMPAVHLGHNRDLVWTATTTHADTMDTWQVPAVDGVVTIAGSDIPITYRRETIQVKNAEAVVAELEDVPGYGILLPADLAPIPITNPGERILFNWVGFEPTREAQTFVQVNRAKNLDEFETAIDRMELGLFNFIAADKAGITLRSSPKVPDRGTPDSDLRPYELQDGNNPDTQWPKTSLSLDKLPHSRNPKRGWLTSSNNDPLGFTADSSVVDDAYYFGVFFDAGTRAARAENEITRIIGEAPATLEQMKALQLDAYLTPADILIPELTAVYSTVASDPALSRYQGRADLDQLMQLLADWDRKMVRDSSAAVVFNAYMFFVARRAIADDMPAVFDAIVEANALYALKVAFRVINGSFGSAEKYLQEGKSSVMMLALDDTADWLVERFGSSDPQNYQWSDYHGTTFPSPWGDALSGPFIPTDGSNGTINVSPKSFFREGEPRQLLESSTGAIYRMVASFDDMGRPRAQINFPRGNAGDPQSPFFDNTLNDWVEGNYQPLLYDAAEVDADAQESWQLTP